MIYSVHRFMLWAYGQQIRFKSTCSVGPGSQVSDGADWDLTKLMQDLDFQTGSSASMLMPAQWTPLMSVDETGLSLAQHLMKVPSSDQKEKA